MFNHTSYYSRTNKVCSRNISSRKTELFGETARSQCSCMTLAAIACSVIKKIGRWDRTDLDIILSNGDVVSGKQTKNTNIGKQTFLIVEELPRNVELTGKGFMTECKENKCVFLFGGFKYLQNYLGKCDR